jgi:hypothetical protein
MPKFKQISNFQQSNSIFKIANALKEQTIPAQDNVLGKNKLMEWNSPERAL